MTPREQGDFGERSALNWLADQGAHVYLPFGHSPDIDLVAELDGRLISVEVKTGTSKAPGGNWAIRLATSGGNQSWNRIVKHFEPSRCDFLFAHVGDGRRWFIPTDALGARNSVHLGGAKYSEFEVDAGLPIVRPDREGTRTPGADAPSTMPLSLRGSAGAGEPGPAVNRMPSAEWVRIPPPPSRPSELFPEPLGKYRTKASANRAIVIPKGCFEEAGLEIGDRLAVQSCGDGRVLFTRIDDPQDASALLNSS